MPLSADGADTGAHLARAARTGRVLVPLQSSARKARRAADDENNLRDDSTRPASSEAPVDRIDRLAKRHRRTLLGGIMISLLGMGCSVWLYGFRDTGTGIGAEMLQMLFGGIALTCALAVVCFTVLLADWFTDYSLALEDAREYERDREMFLQRFSSVLGSSAA